MVERFVNSQMQLADKDGSGEIDLEEFITLYKKLVASGGSSSPAVRISFPTTIVHRPCLLASFPARRFCTPWYGNSWRRPKKEVDHLIKTTCLIGIDVALLFCLINSYLMKPKLLGIRSLNDLKLGAAKLIPFVSVLFSFYCAMAYAVPPLLRRCSLDALLGLDSLGSGTGAPPSVKMISMWLGLDM